MRKKYFAGKCVTESPHKNAIRVIDPAQRKKRRRKVNTPDISASAVLVMTTKDELFVRYSIAICISISSTEIAYEERRYRIRRVGFLRPRGSLSRKEKGEKARNDERLLRHATGFSMRNASRLSRAQGIRGIAR